MKKYLFLTLIFSIISCKEKKLDIMFDVPGRHKWKTKTIGFHINRGANTISETAIRETFQNWGEKTGFNFIYKGRNTAGLIQDGKNTVSFLLKWPKEVPITKIAYCHKWYDKKGNIIESDIILNMQIARFTTKRINKSDWYILEGVLAHEIGHLLGLRHSKKPDSIMKEKSAMKESYFKGKIDKGTLAKFQKLYTKR